MPTTQLSTAAAAKIFAALTILSPPTVSPLGNLLDQPTRTVPKTTSRWPFAETDAQPDYKSTVQTTLIVPTAIVPENDSADRSTTSREKLIGEVRRWSLLRANWDDEGAQIPVTRSLREAVSFIRLLPEGDVLPEPMLHATGHAGLFWKDSAFYADIEFLGDGRIAYYIERHGDKHKGVVKFDSKNMPPVFAALLQP